MVATSDSASLQSTVVGYIAGSGAKMGAFIRHLDSGETVESDADGLYLLASVFKIPILLEALAQVDERKLRLDERFALRWQDQLPTSMILEHLAPGLQLSLRDLLTAMVTVSDNTATDMVAGIVGLENVMRRLDGWGLKNIAIRMSVEGLFNSAFRWPDSNRAIVETYREAVSHGPLVDPLTGVVDSPFMEGLRRGPNYDALPAKLSLDNNVSSPRAMGELLERLVRGHLLSPTGTRMALDIMLRQQLNQRLPRFLPPSARMAHKTGTFYNARNDAGILYLPDGGKAIVVIFAVLDRDRMHADPLESVPYIDRVDSAMGHIARSAYDAFVSFADA
ncbi:MAG TPA: serine hydrolase [Chloroflexota bacterium]|jgi:beta-lactamase class A|nr:serine hydrolase [Chloroflexota bacterium]